MPRGGYIVVENPEQEFSITNLLHLLGLSSKNCRAFLFTVNNIKIVPGELGGTVAFTFVILVRETLHQAKLISFGCLIPCLYKEQF